MTLVLTQRVVGLFSDAAETVVLWLLFIIGVGILLTGVVPVVSRIILIIRRFVRL